MKISFFKRLRLKFTSLCASLDLSGRQSFPHLPRALLQGHQTIHCFLSFTPSPAFHCNPNLVFYLTALSWQL